MYVYVTGSTKTSHVRTKIEIHFIAQDYSYTQEVSMHSVSTPISVGLLFWKGFCRPCNVTVKRMAPIEGTNCVAMS